MDAWVINLETEQQRWQTMKRQLTSYGIEPHRWNATADDHQQRTWAGLPIPDPSRRYAITQSHRTLLDYLSNLATERFLILQDDVVISRNPHRNRPGLIHVYGGWRVRDLRPGDDGLWRPVPGTWHQSRSHVCPQAFSIHRDIIPELVAAWTNGNRQVCHLWRPLLKRYATFDEEPTIEPRQTN